MQPARTLNQFQVRLLILRVVENQLRNVLAATSDGVDHVCHRPRADQRATGFEPHNSVILWMTTQARQMTGIRSPVRVDSRGLRNVAAFDLNLSRQQAELSASKQYHRAVSNRSSNYTVEL